MAPPSALERLRWTDERIEERVAAIDERFDRQFEEFRMVREEMGDGLAAQVTLIVAGFGVGLLGLLAPWQL